LNPSDGYWYIATNATESTVKGELGIAWTSPIATAAIGDKIIVVRKGMLRYSSWSWSTTGPIYLSTAGGLTQTVPTASGTSVKVVGKPGRLTSVMFFNPEPGWMLLV
jgi:hypothetical protein